MAAITKHVGRHGDRKVAVIFREIPGESHMALVVYTQIVNRHVHDAIMECINSDSGQQSENLADALNRAYTRDGKIVLQQLHAEGQLKKVRTDQIIMTPTPSAKHDVKLSDLNELIDKMNAGEQAMKEMAEIDASRGLQDPADVARRIKEKKAAQHTEVSQKENQAYQASDMSDAAIAWRMRQQAHKMAAEARGLIAESERILKEADALNPEKTSTAQIIESTETSVQTPVKKSRSRVKKNVTAEQA